RDPRAPDDPAACRRDLPSVAEESPHPGQVSRESEVVAHQDQRVECPQAPRQALDARLIDLLDAAHSGQSDLRRRSIDAHHAMSFPLEVDGVTTRATTDVQDATADLLHRRAFDLRPARVRAEVRLDVRVPATPT